MSTPKQRRAGRPRGVMPPPKCSDGRSASPTWLDPPPRTGPAPRLSGSSATLVFAGIGPSGERLPPLILVQYEKGACQTLLPVSVRPRSDWVVPPRQDTQDRLRQMLVVRHRPAADSLSSRRQVPGVGRPGARDVLYSQVQQVLGYSMRDAKRQGGKSPNAGSPIELSSSYRPRRPDQPLVNNGAHNFHSYLQSSEKRCAIRLLCRTVTDQ